MRDTREKVRRQGEARLPRGRPDLHPKWARSGEVWHHRCSSSFAVLGLERAFCEVCGTKRPSKAIPEGVQQP